MRITVCSMVFGLLGAFYIRAHTTACLENMSERVCLTRFGQTPESLHARESNGLGRNTYNIEQTARTYRRGEH